MFIPKNPSKNYNDHLHELFPEYNNKKIKTVTLQVTDDCCMACSYCYQHQKNHNKMTISTGKKIIDFILDPNNPYINPKICPAIILEFIGGEPFIAIDEISIIADYFIEKLILSNHPWLNRFRFSICSNGLLYFEPKVQKFFQKYNNYLSFNISIDGNKELHDSCRVDLFGNGTYDRAMEAVNHYRQFYSKNQKIGTKMTLAPNNIQFTSAAVKNLIANDYPEINLNCIFEEGWNINHGIVLYSELKDLTNFLIETNTYKTHYISLFNFHNFCPKDRKEDGNWCGGTNEYMLAFDWQGNIFPCLRYMESSLSNNQEPIIIGHLSHGFYQTNKEKYWQQELNGVTRSCQSTEECMKCPIATGCAWCSAYNYEKFGTVRKRATFICPMHKATSLANAYYWNLVFIKENDPRRFRIWLPDEEALKFVSKKELNMLHFLENFPTNINIPELLEVINQFNDINNLEDIIITYREVKKEMGE